MENSVFAFTLNTRSTSFTNASLFTSQSGHAYELEKQVENRKKLEKTCRSSIYIPRSPAWPFDPVNPSFPGKPRETYHGKFCIYNVLNN